MIRSAEWVAVEPAGEIHELASTLRVGVMRLERRLRSERSSEGLTVSQLSVLGILGQRGPLSPTQLAAIERVQPPSMTRVIGALEELGLVHRHAHETDGRQSVIALSDAGRALLAEDRSRRQAWLARRLEELSPKQREALRLAAPIMQVLAES
ncbi:MAG: MarR family transcriptional regulator [Acidimicrobiales bacterium]|jgi:DNA-binding MarR family transcriptional regulator